MLGDIEARRVIHNVESAVAGQQGKGVPGNVVWEGAVAYVIRLVNQILFSFRSHPCSFHHPHAPVGAGRVALEEAAPARAKRLLHLRHAGPARRANPGHGQQRREEEAECELEYRDLCCKGVVAWSILN